MDVDGAVTQANEQRAAAREGANVAVPSGGRVVLRLATTVLAARALARAEGGGSTVSAQA